MTRPGMLRLLLPLTCLTIMACGSRQPADPWVPPWAVRSDPPISIAELLDRLEVLRKHRQSPQLLLRDATHECRRAMQNLPWAGVEPQLRELGLTRVEGKETYFEYLLVPEMWTSKDGATHSLLVGVAVNRQPAKKSLAQVEPGNVWLSYAILRCDTPRPYADVMDQKAYETFPALDRLLQSLEVFEAAREFPILASVEVSYDYGIYVSSEVLGQEFRSHCELTDAAAEPRRGRNFRSTAESGLDPVLDGRSEKIDRRHVPRDILEDARTISSGGWQREIHNP